MIVFILFLFLFGNMAHMDALSWLRASKTKIVNEQNDEVVLRGVNLGSWLVEELWMLPIVKENIVDHKTLWDAIDKRFGKEKMVKIRKGFRNAWINESDFARIKNAGLNLVRLPFLASLLEEEDGLALLDSTVEACGKLGLYVLLDMHGTYGSQSNEHHTGVAGLNMLFKDPQMVQKTAAAWEKIALHFKDNPTVCGYDLMNEPMGAPDTKTLHQVHDVFYQAIRKVDSRHLIFIEDGYKGIKRIPDPKKLGWKQVVFSTHTYLSGADSEKECLERFDAHMQIVTEQQARYSVPYYLGEFNIKPSSETKQILTKLITKLQESKRSWSLWSYKLAGRCPRGKNWGLYLPPKKLKRIDPFHDSEKEILKKIEQLRTENFTKNDPLFELLQATKLYGGYASYLSTCDATNSESWMSKINSNIALTIV